MAHNISQLVAKTVTNSQTPSFTDVVNLFGIKQLFLHNYNNYIVYIRHW